ncbi:macrolide 2'-phosphotransferase [Arthrobacter castelli]|uniref:macrolide 2'-phosphotransferase n=1 Tax=Arthrobacter castelli TaxID=271431 RepID=UPI00041A90C3|nr:macrolide 2'-phosphotransferase [Arthrobacter castelli]
MQQTDTSQPSEVAALAASHGLIIDKSSVTFNEAGLDYRVAFARDDDGAGWVLRIPRRTDVSAKIADEARILDFVKHELSVAVPDWRIRSDELIAYPLLPGDPGLTLDAGTGEPVWHFDRESPVYARSLGRLIAELHQIDTRAAETSGTPVQSPAEVREEWSTNLDHVRSEFTISDDLLAAWDAWLADDELWPERSSFTHGELYPAHLLLAGDGTIESVLDWTTAKVGDPVSDFALHHMVSTPETFQLSVEAYAAAGGHVPVRLEERCEALASASPINYGVYALTTGDPEHAAAAAAQLNP